MTTDRQRLAGGAIRGAPGAADRPRVPHPEVPLEPDATAPAADDDEADPEHEALLADALGLALLVVLDTLTPPERVAFVLHDMFGVPFDDIAPIVRRSAPATRQLASRARRRVRNEDPAGEIDRLRQAKLVDAFLAAARGGDFDGLLAVLDPDVVLRSDPTAAALGGPRETRGARPAAEFLKVARGARSAMLDGEPVAVWRPGGELRVVYRFTTSRDRITGVELIADPAVLARVDI